MTIDALVAVSGEGGRWWGGRKGGRGVETAALRLTVFPRRLEAARKANLGRNPQLTRRAGSYLTADGSSTRESRGEQRCDQLTTPRSDHPRVVTPRVE